MIRTQRNIPKGYVNGVGSFLGVDPDFDDIEGVEAWAVDTIARCGTLDAEYSTHKGPCNETHPTFEEVLETIEAVPPKKAKPHQKAKPPMHRKRGPTLDQFLDDAIHRLSDVPMVRAASGNWVPSPIGDVK